MTHPIVIQTTEMMEYRMGEQLRRRKVDSSLYALGGEWTAQAFKKWDEESPPPWDITHGPSRDHYGGERCVVDLGPGSGQPCLAAIKVILDHIHEIVLVDVSPEMLSMAQDYLHRNTQAAITCIIADFLQDAAALDAVLKGFPRPRLFLCLGRTVGNFDQCYVLRTLQSYLREDDYLLLDVGLYPPKHTEDFLKDLANRYMGGKTSYSDCISLRPAMLGQLPDIPLQALARMMKTRPHRSYASFIVFPKTLCSQWGKIRLSSKRVSACRF